MKEWWYSGYEVWSKIYEMPIEDLELTVRAYNCLKRAGITQVGEILEKLKKGQDEILAIRNFGQKSLDELMERLEEKGYLELLNEDGTELTDVVMPELTD